MSIKLEGIEQPFKLEILSKAGANFSILEQREITIGASKITIPQGFKTDLATIPQLLWAFFPPIGTGNEQYATPAILHDFLYTYKVFPRRKCDLVFLSAMKQYRVRSFVRYSFYLSVRLFGRKHYRMT